MLFVSALASVLVVHCASASEGRTERSAAQRAVLRHDVMVPPSLVRPSPATEPTPHGQREFVPGATLRDDAPRATLAGSSIRRSRSQLASGSSVDGDVTRPG